MKRQTWYLKEIEFLTGNYETMTIKELQQGLENLWPERSDRASKRRSADSINAKIKRLKTDKKLAGQKDKETVNRSLIQRRKDI